MPIHFTAALERDKDGTWWYVHVPAAIRQSLQQFARRGSIPVTARVGDTSWNASLLPWADGSAQLVVKKDVRDKESLQLGESVDVAVTPRGS